MSQDISSLRSELLKTQQQLSHLLETCLTREPLLPRLALYPAAKVRQTKLPLQPR